MDLRPGACLRSLRRYHQGMPHLRYQVSKNADDQYWSIVDIFTGWPIDFHGVLLDTLEAEEADRMVDVVNLGDFARRGQLRPLR